MPPANQLEAISAGSDAQAIIDAMSKLYGVESIDIDGGGEGAIVHQILALPKGVELRSIKPFLDEYLGKPERRQGTARLTDLASFVDHAVRFKDEHSAIFATRDEENPSLLSVLDYHPAGSDNAAARFGRHRGSYAFPASEAWEAWRAADGKSLAQAQFAGFIEERIMDVVPPPADGRSDAGALTLDLLQMLKGEIAGPSRLLEIARSLKMTESADVTNAQTLATGEVEVVYRTEHRDGAGQPLKVPNLFIIGVPVFDGDGAYKMPVRLQYRRQEGRIFWTLKRYRPDVVFFDAFDRAVAAVREGTGLPVFIGTPEA